MSMKLARSFERVAAAAVAAVAAASCAPAASIDAKYPTAQCRRVALIDAETGALIRGAEDIAIDPARGRLFVSAYDRRGVEKAVRKRAFSLPEGGVYIAEFAALAAADASDFEVAPLVRAADVAGGLRPHGIAYNSDLDEVVFINRAYQKLGRQWRMTPRLERIGSNGEIIVGAETQARCAANDLIDGGGATLISFDHGACGWRAAIEDALTLRRSGVASAAGDALFDAAAFANGLARLADGELALAATRESAVLFLERSPRGYAEIRRVKTPGGPDNLTLAPDGGVVAAVHPSLFQMGLHRRLGFGRAPSRVVKADHDGNIEVLFDDPRGTLFSGATVAVEHDGALVLGSATDAGLLVCRAAP